MNSPKNPVEEFSTREYGRFGFFFKKDLKRDENFEVSYRFLVRNAEAPAEKSKRSASQLAQARKEADAAYAKLGNAGFVAKAPEEVIEEQKEKRAEAAATATRLEEALKRLSS